MAITTSDLKRWLYQRHLTRWKLEIHTHLSFALAIALTLLVVFREWDELGRAAHLLNAWQWVLCVSAVFALVLVPRFYMVGVIRKWNLGLRDWLLTLLPTATALILGLRETTNVYQRLAKAPIITSRTDGRWELLVLIITVGTIFAACWEIFGEKLSSEQRDIAFSTTMREAITQLHNFKQSGASDSALTTFLKFIVDSACSAVGGRQPVHGALLQPSDDGHFLVPLVVSQKAPYAPGFQIPIDSLHGGPGAAGLVFAQEQAYVGHVNDTKLCEAWLFNWNFEKLAYEMPSPPQIAWTNTPPTAKKLKASLSVPVRVYRVTTNTVKTIAVLTFSSDTNDPFFDRDYLMAECFAHLISQTFEVQPPALKPEA